MDTKDVKILLWKLGNRSNEFCLDDLRKALLSRGTGSWRDRDSVRKTSPVRKCPSQQDPNCRTEKIPLSLLDIQALFTELNWTDFQEFKVIGCAQKCWILQQTVSLSSRKWEEMRLEKDVKRIWLLLYTTGQCYENSFYSPKSANTYPQLETGQNK